MRQLILTKLNPDRQLYSVQYENITTYIECERKDLWREVSNVMAGKPTAVEMPMVMKQAYTIHFLEYEDNKTIAITKRDGIFSKDTTSFLYDIAILFEDIERKTNGI